MIYGDGRFADIAIRIGSLFVVGGVRTLSLGWFVLDLSGSLLQSLWSGISTGTVNARFGVYVSAFSFDGFKNLQRIGIGNSNRNLVHSHLLPPYHLQLLCSLPLLPCPKR